MECEHLWADIETIITTYNRWSQKAACIKCGMLRWSDGIVTKEALDDHGES
jgi:hypothetical protein